MSDFNCNACADLRENAPDFVVNGTTETICTSLQNNTGLNPNLTVLHDNDEDLQNANDCLIGMEISQVESYEVCDWKDFMKKHLSNLYELIKAILCGIKGLWKKVEKHDCQIGALANGINFTIGESATDNSYIVPGEGVSFLARSESSQVVGSDIVMRYIAGGLASVTGGLTFYAVNFQDLDGTSRSGNTEWRTSQASPTYGDELVYEIRMKKSAYPQVKAFFDGIGQQLFAHGFDVSVGHYEAGTYAHGQHGHCHSADGTPMGSGMSSGHLVPDGWTYIQVRMTWIDHLVTASGESASATPYAFFGMRVATEDIC